MKRLAFTLALAAVVAALVFFYRSTAFAAGPAQRFEYATIHWAGRENTHVIRPGGKVEFAGPQLLHVTKPDKTDERAFYMNVVVNALTKEGYEVAAMTQDDVLLKRALAQ